CFPGFRSWLESIRVSGAREAGRGSSTPMIKSWSMKTPY
ncbi:MAG: hypothetical protein AVDCRST_MAG05-3849, partial [uncultured Rubrobacteraceae bacterium]